MYLLFEAIRLGGPSILAYNYNLDKLTLNLMRFWLGVRISGLRVHDTGVFGEHITAGMRVQGGDVKASIYLLERLGEAGGFLRSCLKSSEYRLKGPKRLPECREILHLHRKVRISGAVLSLT